MPVSPARIARAAALMALGLALPAAAQPWETAPPPPFLRPMAKPTPIQPAPKAAAPKPAPAAKTPAPKTPAAKTPAAKAPEPKPAAKPAPAPAQKPPAALPAAAKPAPPAAAAAKPAAPPPTQSAPKPAATPVPAPRPAAAPAPAANRSAVIIIDSSEIADPQTGVRQLARISAQLTQEFAARSDNVDKLKAQAEKAQADLKAAKPAAAKTLAPKVKAQVDQYEAETKSFENAYNARSQALVVPVQRQVNDALTAFANARGATVVIDGSRFNESVLMLQKGVNPNALDLTRAFIDSYNAAHP